MNWTATARRTANPEHEKLLDKLLNKLSAKLGRPFYGSKIQREALLFRIAYVFKPSATMVDIGGGLSPANAVLSELGMKVIVHDLLSTYWDNRYFSHDEIRKIITELETCGVKFVEENVEAADLESIYGSNCLDYVVSHHCIEHFHNSPKPMLESAIRAVKSGGRLIIEVPNAANVRKRIYLLLGRTNYGSYNEYYNSKEFFGHVREYTTGDLRLLAKNLNQGDYTIFGTNYLGLEQVPQALRQAFDLTLKLRPGLCASIYLDIRKSKPIKPA